MLFNNRAKLWNKKRNVSETKLFISEAKHVIRCNATYYLNHFLKGRYLRNKECEFPKKNIMLFVIKTLEGRMSKIHNLLKGERNDGV